MRIFFRLLPIALLATALVACNRGSSDNSGVAATVNGTPITNDMVGAYVRSQTNGQDIQLNDQQRQAVIKTLVNMELLAEAARKEGLDKKPQVAADLAMSQNGLLAQTDVAEYMKAHQPTDAQLQAAYQDQVKSADTREYKARHILVDSEDQAKDIITKLGKGGSFAALAKQYSKDPGSKNNGGDLGDWFPGSSMVPEFSAALAGLKKGEYTKQPVHTQYGWHVIQLEDERTSTPPSFDQVREKLTEQLERKTVSDYLDQLRAGAKVVVNSAPAAASKAPAVKP